MELGHVDVQIKGRLLRLVAALGAYVVYISYSLHPNNQYTQLGEDR